MGHFVHIFHLVFLAVGQSHLKLLFANSRFFHFLMQGAGQSREHLLGLRIMASSVTRWV